jgi:hypothetical protein
MTRRHPVLEIHIAEQCPARRGFPPILRLESAIGASASASDCLRLVGDLIPNLLPALEHLGIAPASEVALDTRLGTRVVARERLTPPS